MMRQRKLAPRRATSLPNASTIGYGQWKALPGDYVIVTGNGPDAFGRVLGQIIECDSDGQDCRGYLAVAVISQDLSFGYERWIAPAEVKSCVRPDHVNRFMRAFLGADVAETCRALAANSGILADGSNGHLWESPAQQHTLATIYADSGLEYVSNDLTAREDGN